MLELFIAQAVADEGGIPSWSYLVPLGVAFLGLLGVGLQLIRRRNAADDQDADAPTNVLAEIIDALERQTQKAEDRAADLMKQLDRCRRQHIADAVLIERLTNELKHAEAERDISRAQLDAIRREVGQ